MSIAEEVTAGFLLLLQPTPTRATASNTSFNACFMAFSVLVSFQSRPSMARVIQKELSDCAHETLERSPRKSLKIPSNPCRNV
jgi:hypothetical protein